MARKVKMKPLRDADIPVFPALGRRITEEAQNQQQSNVRAGQVTVIIRW